MWRIKSLVQLEEEGLVQLGRGKVISKKDLAANVGSYPVYSSSKVGDGKFGEYGLYMFDEELITWSVDGGGRLFYREKHKFSTTNVTGFLRILDTRVLSYKYLFHALCLLHSKINFDWVKKAHPSVLRKEYLCIPLPPLAEQQRIVAKLDAAFAEIDRAVESYEDSVSNAKDCLSKVRASRVTEVLSSSQTAKFGSLASLKNGLNYNKSEKGYSVKILGVGDFGNRFSIGTEDLKVIETNSPVSTDYHLEHGDIVFVRSNGNKQLIGRSIVIENPSEPATFSGFCIRCRIETADMSPLFLCHYLKSSVVRDKLISEGGGANISNLNQKMLADIDVPLLSQHEQISLIRWIEELEKSFEDFVETLIKRVQLADNLKSAILAQELQPPQSEAA